MQLDIVYYPKHYHVMRHAMDLVCSVHEKNLGWRAHLGGLLTYKRFIPASTRRRKGKIVITVAGSIIADILPEPSIVCLNRAQLRLSTKSDFTLAVQFPIPARYSHASRFLYLWWAASVTTPWDVLFARR